MRGVYRWTHSNLFMIFRFYVTGLYMTPSLIQIYPSVSKKWAHNRIRQTHLAQQTDPGDNLTKTNIEKKNWILTAFLRLERAPCKAAEEKDQLEPTTPAHDCRVKFRSVHERVRVWPLRLLAHQPFFYSSNGFIESPEWCHGQVTWSPPVPLIWGVGRGLFFAMALCRIK